MCGLKQEGPSSKASHYHMKHIWEGTAAVTNVYDGITAATLVLQHAGCLLS